MKKVYFFVCLLVNLLTATQLLHAQCMTVINGSLSAGDQTLNRRLSRPSGIPESTCVAPVNCPGQNGNAGPFFYDTYTFANTTSAPQCITLAYTSVCVNSIQPSVYLTSFNPANLCQNYISSILTTNTTSLMAFIVPANSTYVVVVNQVFAGLTCSRYTLTLRANTPALPPAISNLAASGPVGCGVPAQLTGTASGEYFVFTGPNGYVFSNAFRTAGTYAIQADGITVPGQYQLMSYANYGFDCVTDMRTITVEGSGCSDNKVLQPPTGSPNDVGN